MYVHYMHADREKEKKGGVGEAATEWSEVVVAEQTKL
jgi:hypothetical protein